MIKPRCPACQKELPNDSSYCPSCGASVASDAETQRLEAYQTPLRSAQADSPAPNVSSRSPTFDSLDDARFVPGTLLADRYRIVGLLGKGGMGEVYRADDLKLGQAVALKFLPDNLLHDGASVARFHREVRVARQVSHKNVCRVYDIGEVNGHHFLSMEFIKGEELSSLLRRIGRLPVDKAVQIARQICAGLAAAHERGVLHRDLKPANVMIDADGNARITDFGLAGLAEEFYEEEMVAGTPAYMAPEQLEGKGVTVRSDIYSLGLVLYEVFTGKRAFVADTLGELIKLRRSDITPTTPTSIIKDLDPVIESVIDRCLQKDPAKRPSSALQVAAALPGGDPLAAALAAGETPSPEMVAAAAREGALRPAVALACLAGQVFCLVFLFASSKYVRMEPNIPLEKPTEVLAANARDILNNLGYPSSHLDSAYGFGADSSFYRYLQQSGSQNWQMLRTGQPLAIYFWYRQSPRVMVPVESAVLSFFDPRANISGMTGLTLDVRGRLVRFDRLPPQREADTDAEQMLSHRSTDWTVLFQAAGLEPANFKQTPPRWVPSMYADERASWEGMHPDHADIPVRIEAAAFRNKPVHFAVIFPWDRPLRDEEQNLTPAVRAAAIILVILFFGVLVGAAFLARRNMQLGRTDKKGAFRLALFIFFVSEIGLLIGARHVPLLSGELSIAYMITAAALLPAALIWLLYIALEPYVRRSWPRLIISWTRLMAGGFRDPMVGRDLLIGGLLGLAHSSAISFGALAQRPLGYTKPVPLLTPESLQGSRTLLLILSDQIVLSIFAGLAALFVLLLLYMILRQQWSAALALWAIVFAVEVLAFGSSGGPRIYWIASAIIATILVIAVARFGLLASIVHQVFFLLSLVYPQTTDFSAWYVQSLLFPLVIMLALISYGFYTSLGGQPLFKGSLLRD